MNDFTSTRREFLVSTAAAAAMMAIPGSLARAADAENGGRKLGWAMVGIGSLTMGQLIPAIAKSSNSRLAALVTGHPEKAKKYFDQFGLSEKNVYTYDNFDAIANDPSIDVVNIVLPNGMHAEYTNRAFKAGKHVLCEKPMANTSVECQSMIDAARAAKKKLMIAYRIRREPNNLKAIEIVQSGQFGKARLITSDHGFHLSDPSVWRLNKKLAGGGAIFDIGIYGLNAARYLSGEEPAAVSAQLIENPGDPRFKEVEEGMVWTMRFPSGCLVSMTTSYNIAGANRIRVIFEKGNMSMEPATGYRGNKLRLGPITSQPIAEPEIDQFQVQTEYFSDCVINDREPITSGEEGLKDIRIIEALYESARTGKTVELS